MFVIAALSGNDRNEDEDSLRIAKIWEDWGEKIRQSAGHQIPEFWNTKPGKDSSAMSQEEAGID